MHSLLELSQANGVLAAQLAVSPDPRIRHHASLLQVCSHGFDGSRISHCRSPLCLLCQRWQTETDNHVLKLRAASLQVQFPKANWFFGTFGLIDTATEQVRGAVKKLGTAWNGLTKRVHSLVGAFRSVEVVPSGVSSAAENAHVHGLLAVGGGYSGRNRLSTADWQEAFNQEVGTLARVARVEKVRNLDHAIDYCLPWGVGGEKGYIARAEEAIQDPTRYVERIRQLSGLHRHSYSGMLQGQPVPAPDETGLFRDSRSQWKTFEGRLAREMNPKSRRPLQLIPIAQ